MPVTRDQMLTVMVSEVEQHQLKTLAEDADVNVSQLVRGWLRAAWAARMAAENARAYSNGEPAEDLDEKGA